MVGIAPLGGAAGVGGEAVGEDLIHHAFPEPRGGLEPPAVYGQAEAGAVRHGHPAGFFPESPAQTAGAEGTQFQAEMIPQRQRGRWHLIGAGQVRTKGLLVNVVIPGAHQNGGRDQPRVVLEPQLDHAVRGHRADGGTEALRGAVVRDEPGQDRIQTADDCRVFSRGIRQQAHQLRGAGLDVVKILRRGLPRSHRREKLASGDNAQRLFPAKPPVIQARRASAPAGIPPAPGGRSAPKKIQADGRYRRHPRP